MENKINILLVDDSTTQRRIIQRSLEKQGYNVFTAGDAITGVNMVYQEPPDLIISDVIMPELNGYQFCRIVKNDPALSNIPIILLTSLGQKRDRFWGKEAGAESYVVKKADASELFREIERLLNGGKTSKSEQQKEREARPESMNNGSVTSRINILLDRMLFESTISNRIRESMLFSYTIEEIIANFFDVLNQLLEYTSASILVNDEDKKLLYVDIKEEVGKNHIEEIQELLPGSSEKSAKHKFGCIAVTGSELMRQNSEGNILSSVNIPLAAGDAVLGNLLVMSKFKNTYDDSTRRTLGIVTRELVMITRYILKMQEIERIKTDFTSMMVHDLRSPITGIKLCLDILQKGMLGELNDKQKEMSQRAMSSLHRILDLVNDLLDVSKLESGKLDMEPEKFSLHQVIESSLSTLEIQAKEQEISLDISIEEGLPEVYGDPARIEQVMVNLLSNAVKFTPSGGKITIGARYVSAQDGDVSSPLPLIKVWVEDTGAGIPEDDLELVFEKYRQLKTGKVSEKKGTGLGLVICKMIVESHGGEIWVESTEGEGTTFFFTLPARSL